MDEPENLFVMVISIDIDLKETPCQGRKRGTFFNRAKKKYPPEEESSACGIHFGDAPPFAEEPSLKKPTFDVCKIKK